MSNTDLGGGNIVSMQGFVDITLVNQKTGSKQHFQKNTITIIGRLMWLAQGPAIQLLQPSGIDRGMLYIESGFGRTHTRDGDRLYQPTIDSGLTLYLANINDVLTEDNRMLPIYGVDAKIDQTKLTGYASMRRTPQTSKEGIIDRVHDEFMVDKFSAVQRWQFPAANANGQITHLLIGAGVINDRGNGFALSKGINSLDIAAYGGTNSICSRYMRPGVPGYTSSTEILISTGDQNQTTANAIYDLATGKQTSLIEGDPRHGAPLAEPHAPQYINGTDLYYVQNGYLKRLDTVTKTKEDIASCSGQLAKVGNMLYIYSDRGSSLQGYDMSTKSWGSSLDLRQQTFAADWFKNTSYDMPLSYCGLGTLDNGNHILVPLQDSSYGPKWAIEFTDLSNISGSIIGIRPRIRSASEYNVNGKLINIWSNVKSNFGWTYIDGASETSTNDTYRDEYGLKFSESWYGNMISYVQLASPITKTEDDVLYVSYGYKIL